MKTMATQLVVALIVTQVAVGQESLREIGRQHTGPIETLIFREFFPVEIAQMARDSDLIARVRVVDNGESYFTEGERSISSDYKIQLIEQFASPRSLINGDTVVVTKPGGTLTVDGREIAVSERDFPPFQLG